MAVRIRMKRMGRTHRPFYRICAMDRRTPRDGRVLEELGTYDPSIEDTDARAVLRKERVDYWLSVGAQPSEKVAVLIKKYGTNGTHADQQAKSLDRLAEPKIVPDAGPAVSKPKSEEPPAEQAAETNADKQTGSAETSDPEAPSEQAKSEPEPAAKVEEDKSEGA